jgi:hypothetical protein
MQRRFGWLPGRAIDVVCNVAELNRSNRQTTTCSGEITCYSNLYQWTLSGTAADGSLFETFLATLNGGDYYSPSVGQDVSAGVGTCLANHCDWRIPTVAELQTIVELSASGCGSGSPCIDPAFGPTQAAFYWSSSSFGAAGLSAWWVYFPNGIAGLQPKMVPLNIYARAVRGGR